MPTKKEREKTKEKGKRIDKEKKEIEKPKKVSMTEIEKIIVELAAKGLTSEKIGENLRKQGIHTQEYEIKVSQVLRDNKLYINPDLKNIESKLEKLRVHYAKNKQDKKAKREIDRVASQLRIYQHYFKR